jgi:hypothetical protein
MEEVVSSNLTRSTKTFQTLSANMPAQGPSGGVQLESKNGHQHTTGRFDFMAPSLTLIVLWD